MKYEREYLPDTPQVDEVLLYDGRGDYVKMEVPDDARNN